MPEENKAIVRRLMEEVWTKGNLSLADQFFFANYTHHGTSTPDFGPGPVRLPLKSLNIATLAIWSKRG